MNEYLGILILYIYYLYSKEDINVICNYVVLYVGVMKIWNIFLGFFKKLF